MVLSDAPLDHKIQLRDWRPGNHKTLCPQCSHTRKNKRDPCLSVTIDGDGKAVWLCHHCGWAGGTPPERRDDFQRRPRPAQRAYKRPVGDCEGTKSARLYEWFAKRGISAKVVDRYGVTFRRVYIPAKNAQEWAIAFPYYRGPDLVGIKYRTIDKCFAQEKDCEPIWYGLNDVQGVATAIVCEGECDKLAFAEAGISSVLSVPTGAPEKLGDDVPEARDDAKFAFIHNCADDLAHIERFILAVDNDDKGHILSEELARRLGKERCWRVTWPVLGDVAMKDANETLIAHGPEVLREIVEQATPYPVHGLFELRVDDLIEMRRRPIDRGVSTGWPELDEFMRIVPGRLSIVTGLPNSGKSEFIDALMVNIAIAEGWKFALCSLENTVDEHAGKLAEKWAGQPFRQYSSLAPAMTDADLRTAGEWVREHFVFIRDESDKMVGIDWVLERARTAVARYGIRGLVIDPHNELEHHRPSNMSETEYVSLLLSKLKRFGQRNGVHVWYAAHPQKLYAQPGKSITAPGLYDISGSAHFANKADIGLVVHRPDPTTKETEIHIRKVRFKHEGKPGMVRMIWDKTTGRYEVLPDGY